jgi:uncharacterized Zn-finger protein
MQVEHTLNSQLSETIEKLLSSESQKSELEFLFKETSAKLSELMLKHTISNTIISDAEDDISPEQRQASDCEPSPQQKNHPCPHCSLSFDYPSQLKMHIRTHANERPYKCDICKTDFKTKGGLDNHFTGY